MSQLTTPLARYQHVRKSGPLYFIAGQGCRDPQTNQYAGLTLTADGKVSSYDIAAQTSAVLQNIERVLISQKLTRANIIDVTVFMKSKSDFEGMNAVWNNFFAETSPPTRTTIFIADLPGLNYVEMKTIAAADS
jgi:2-aminomuconate deaminase